MFRFIAFLIIVMALLWLLLMAFFRVFVGNGRRVSQSKREFDQLMSEPGRRSGKKRRRRVIMRCDPEPISPPTSVQKYCDRSRLERYADGSEALYDEFGNLVYFKADPKRN